MRRKAAAGWMIVAVAVGGAAPPAEAAKHHRVKAKHHRVNGLIGRVAGRGVARLARNADGTWGVRVSGVGSASAAQPKPAMIEIDVGEKPMPDDGATRLPVVSAGYATIRKVRDGVAGTATLTAEPGVTVEITDRWAIRGGGLKVGREVRVHGSGRGGFASVLTLVNGASADRAHTQYFSPGVLYGGTDHLIDTALGSPVIYGKGYHGVLRVREDRMAAPMFGARFADGSSLTILDAEPDGATVEADAKNAGGATVVDRRMRFGALGAEQPGQGQGLAMGYSFPGSEGEVTFASTTPTTSCPGCAGTGGVADASCPHCWRRREHPLTDGLAQRYRLRMRFAKEEAWDVYRHAAWRWAYDTLKPKVNRQDLDLVRSSVVSMVSDHVLTTPVGATPAMAWMPPYVAHSDHVLTTPVGATGIPSHWDATNGQEIFAPRGIGVRPALMGFIGRNVDNAVSLIEDSELHPGADSAKHRRQGEAIIATLDKLPMSPPAAAGVELNTGQPTSGYPNEHVAYLRALSDDFKALTRGIAFEKAHGHEHPEWTAWARSFADWLVGQQNPDGSFPRGWVNGTGYVFDASTGSTDHPVPFLLDMTTLTGDGRYADAALRAGRFAYEQHAGGQYYGAAVDQGDTVDKEAASLALEADLALYDFTRDAKWLDRAKVDADFEESWTYIWNIPMPVDADNTVLAWKRGVPTTGASIVATGLSAADEFEAENVPEYARLARLTGDAHYRELARLLVHNSQSMVALPGRPYDLVGPGWQQEFWTFSDDRGTGTILGLYRDWVSWIGAVKMRSLLVTEQQAPEVLTPPR